MASQEHLLAHRSQWSYEDKPDKFRRTHNASPAGNFYNENGFYTDLLEGTPDWEDFWDEQTFRCLNGYIVNEGTPDEFYITGFHYFYLNFFPIFRAVQKELPDGTIEEKREFALPRFYDGDWEWFMLVEDARIAKKNLVCLKARRKGYSYKAASMLLRNYFLKRGSRNYVIVSKEDYLVKDGIFNKAWPAMAFVDENTAWSQPRLIDKELQKTSGYKEKVKGTFIEKGMQSTIIGVTIGDDPHKVRGKAGDLVFFEEAGSFKHMLTSWEILQPSMRQGNMFLGSMIAFGTGGEEGGGFDALEELFYRPEAYNVFSVPNKWDDGMADMQSGYFVPDYINLDGFMDENGNSLIKEAIEFRNGTRENKKKASGQRTYDQHVAEHPFTPQEAILNVDHNDFPTAELVAQRNEVIARNYEALGTPGNIVRNASGKLTFKPDYKLEPVLRYPHSLKDGDISGAIVIYESPYTDPATGKVPKGLYIITNDPYGQNKSQGSSSLGATYVIKRTNRFSRPDDIIVASWVGRPASQDDYNRKLFLLAEYYNGKIGFENDRGEVIPFAKRFKKLHYLEEQFEMLHKKELQSATVQREYGMHMTAARKAQGLVYLRDWLLTPRGVDENGNIKLNLHYIYDVALLEELIKYNDEGNFDRVMSMIIGMFHLKELEGVPPTEYQESRADDEFWDRDLFA